ncbi:uncharacterized protein LOC131301490 [Rhododendron vialii]|uniref:uncharacterized protein LOC131301490 n=1 Tax=Rhododendron vialii TaxID=182163 RepID=UPI00265D6D6C|nr:uncharacterized protein LOC131301490 [Rhododendron vialii]
MSHDVYLDQFLLDGRPSIPRAIAMIDGPMDWNEALDTIQHGSLKQDKTIVESSSAYGRAQMARDEVTVDDGDAIFVSPLQDSRLCIGPSAIEGVENGNQLYES